MYAVIRIRGSVDTSKDVEDTLRMLRLNKPNNCIVVPETKEYLGMLRKSKDFIAYGVIDFDTFLEILRKRARLIGNKRLTEDNVKELRFNSIEELAKAIFKNKVKMKEIRNLKPVFRLNPPRKGHKSTRKHYPKGSLGFWGTEINKLLKRMI
ncbi:MAG: 50S ribosomal protein L30 [Candidatus Aenigmarchaeota archaeon]|nr:50S ribosomal protein L30 [Candidatus Aenigmarchaeota archaeon]